MRLGEGKHTSPANDASCAHIAVEPFGFQFRGSTRREEAAPEDRGLGEQGEYQAGTSEIRVLTVRNTPIAQGVVAQFLIVFVTSS